MRQEIKAVDRNTLSIKLTIPPFQGKNNRDSYIEWEREVDLVFDCHNYSNGKKVKLAAWWDQLVPSRIRNNELSISNWEDMKAIMR